MKRQHVILGIAAVAAAAGIATWQLLPKKGGQDKKQKQKTERPAPTFAAVAYGKHPRQILHFWKAESDAPTPVVVLFHGGAWQEGTPMDGTDAQVSAFLKARISVVSAGYRLIEDAVAEKVDPPVKAAMDDAKRAVQFVRSNAVEWNIDKTKLAVSGTSAGGCMSLWLAFHPEMAEPASSDPVARESTRVACAAAHSPQTTLDPLQMKEWTPNSNYGAHAFGVFKKVDGKDVPDFSAWLEQREKLLPFIKEYSPYEHASADDPPVYMQFTDKPAVGKNQADATHTVNFGVKLQERLREVGAESELVYPGAPEVKHKRTKDYLVEKLRGKKP